jgi:hypothetical protein
MTVRLSGRAADPGRAIAQLHRAGATVGDLPAGARFRRVVPGRPIRPRCPRLRTTPRASVPQQRGVGRQRCLRRYTAILPQARLPGAVLVADRRIQAVPPPISATTGSAESSFPPSRRWSRGRAEPTRCCPEMAVRSQTSTPEKCKILTPQLPQKYRVDTAARKKSAYPTAFLANTALVHDASRRRGGVGQKGSRIGETPGKVPHDQ